MRGAHVHGSEQHVYLHQQLGKFHCFPHGLEELLKAKNLATKSFDAAY